MFDQFKQLKKLKELQDSLSDEQVEVEKNGVRIVMDGKLEVRELRINPELCKEEQEAVLKECINEAMGKMRNILAQKMMGMPGLGM